MINNNPYTHFDNFILRTPALSLNFYKTLTAEKEILFSDFKQYFEEPLISEAIYLASPSLHESLKKLYNGEEDFSKKNEESLNLSFLKYLSRMSTRSTPFGLFAGCALADINGYDAITNESPYSNKRFTRLDMNYLVNLTQDLEKIDSVLKELKYYPNSSIYFLKDQIRYIEYFNKNNKRNHKMISIERSNELEKILELSRNGSKLEILIELLISMDFPRDVSQGYIKELINSKLLVSDLEPSVTGGDFFEYIIKTLENCDNSNLILPKLLEVQKSLKELDENIGNTSEKYMIISDLISEIGTSFDPSLLFQSELVLNPSKSSLNKKHILDLKKGITLLNKISVTNKSRALKQFKEEFRVRFDNKEMKLVHALDVDVGIGYGVHRDINSNPLVDNLVLPLEKKSGDASSIKLSAVNQILHSKIVSALVNKEFTIKLEDEDFESFDDTWNELPATFSLMVSLIPGKENKLKFSGFYGSSAANLLARFCHGNKEIKNHVNVIIGKESELTKNKILAEIVHLPKSRIGNILSRPNLRSYEIPYLGKSNLEKEYQINVSDLIISYSNDRMTLKSKKLNKEIVPRLTNAHNFSSDQLPIYHFLCDMQNESKKDSIGLDLKPLTDLFRFIPRIEYMNLIFSEAIWNIEGKDCLRFYEIKENEDLFREINVFIKKHNLPIIVKLIDGDNELPINFQNITSIKMWLKSIKNRDSFLFKEFLFDTNLNESIIEDDTSSEKMNYANELIVSFFKN